MKISALPPSWGIAAVRVMAGIILVVAAYEKYSAGGFDGFVRGATGMGVPAPQFFGIFIPLLEGIGGALLLVGLGARWVAVLFVIEFLVTSFAIKALRQPPFGGWDSMRIDLMLLAAMVAIVLVGPGALALESVLMRARGGALIEEPASA